MVSGETCLRSHIQLVPLSSIVRQACNDIEAFKPLCPPTLRAKRGRGIPVEGLQTDDINS